MLKKDNLYDVVPQVNILLSLSAVVFTAYLVVNLRSPYGMHTLTSKTLKTQPLIDKELSALLQEKPAFKQEIFGKRQLFNASVKKAAEQEARAFVLLGVSIGDKNLAIIRETKGNKDYYCKEGDKVAEFTVKEIFRDKVILESAGSQLEITQ